MAKATETRLISTEGQFSWQQMWTYFKSDICTDEMRAWTMKHMDIVGFITGAMPEVQFEILQYAPKVLMNHKAIVSKLNSKTIHNLLPYGMSQEYDTYGIEYEEWVRLGRPALQ